MPASAELDPAQRAHLDTQLAAARALAHAAAARAGATRVIAIDGPSGAGKSTFARELATQLGAALVHVEDTYPGWDGLDAGVARIVRDVLIPLATGAAPVLVRWDWDAGIDGATEPLAIGETLVIDGVGIGSALARPYLGALIWIDAPPEERRRRAIARDGARYAPHWERWAEQERLTFAREHTREHADLLFEAAG